MRNSPPSVFITVLTLALLLPGLPVLAQDLDLAGLSRQDMLDDAEERIEEIARVLEQVSLLKERTRRDESDLVKLRCINDKLASIEGYQRLSQDAQSSLVDQVAGDDEEGMRHQYTLIVIASQRVNTLGHDANSCVGEILTYTGDSERNAEVDEDIPDESDPTDTGSAALDLERIVPGTPLPEATPFQ